MCKILIVDDECFERKVSKRIILNGMQQVDIVGEACNGKEAILMNEKLNPDIILMDIKMPILDGLRAAELIKNRDENKIIIFVSACEDFYFVQKAIKIGAKDYLLKSNRTEQLVETIRRHMYPNREYFIDKAIGVYC
ncbi:histidine kinase [Clostridium carboxidivorans P7]|uniref:Stage 0 sporulation protein A homolog n=1 Tax=Clostridium carboxidivorans P7 TaxID=536227 RepID=C6PRI4_9CLOT|nr:response regulator [Clostridium carboxidivorans]AKN31481.1 histidine kinase [Clostridium carboxidivorans P7]EET88165.1 response regulator receiver protein [Clostridium carboxidivorans P7]EFG87121.1 putative chemotaxis protein CheY [Clostridium carboxidivorans P7]